MALSNGHADDDLGGP